MGRRARRRGGSRVGIVRVMDKCTGGGRGRGRGWGRSRYVVVVVVGFAP